MLRSPQAKKRRFAEKPTLTCNEAAINCLPTAIFQIERPVNEKEMWEKLSTEISLNLRKIPQICLLISLASTHLTTSLSTEAEHNDMRLPRWFPFPTVFERNFGIQTTAQVEKCL